jgi:hypothetical protein
MDARLSDQIYECSFVPESWLRVLGQLATLAQARVGFLFMSERFIRVRANRHSGFVTEPDLYARTP